MEKKIKETIPLIILCTLFALTCSLLITFYKAFPVRSDAVESWLNTSSIINGLITPVLTLVSIVLLWVTWKTSKIELKTSNDLLKFERNRQLIKFIVDDISNAYNQEVDDVIMAESFKRAFEILINPEENLQGQAAIEIIKSLLENYTVSHLENDLKAQITNKSRLTHSEVVRKKHDKFSLLLTDDSKLFEIFEQLFKEQLIKVYFENDFFSEHNNHLLAKLKKLFMYLEKIDHEESSTFEILLFVSLFMDKNLLQELSTIPDYKEMLVYNWLLDIIEN